MPIVLNRITPLAYKGLTKPGRHADGGGLYLEISPAGARSWIFRYRFGGRRRDMGLGSPPTVKLSDARALALKARESLQAGIDPIVARDQEIADRKAEFDRQAQEAAQAEEDRVPTFGEYADELLANWEKGFKNAKHRYQWHQSIEVHAAPIRDMALDKIDTDDVLRCLRPIWSRIPEAASKTQNRIERVLGAAKVSGHRTGENPARWKDHLQHLLQSKKKTDVVHHPSMPREALPGFLVLLAKRWAMSARALEFTILTAGRTSEILGAQWQEFDFDKKVWTVPKERMKMNIEHRVALSDKAIVVLKSLKRHKSKDRTHYVFHGQTKQREPIYDQPLSNMAMEMLLRRIDKGKEHTVHGMRSTFRDWVGEATEFSSELAEIALSHKVGDETERAYRRGDMLPRRFPLMEAWAAFCYPEAAGKAKEAA